jgi:hypothetical protein
MYCSLWARAVAPRGSMHASQHKNYLLVVIFLKYVGDRTQADLKLSEFEIHSVNMYIFWWFKRRLYVYLKLKGKYKQADNISSYKESVQPAKHLLTSI